MHLFRGNLLNLNFGLHLRVLLELPDRESSTPLSSCHHLRAKALVAICLWLRRRKPDHRYSLLALKGHRQIVLVSDAWELTILIRDYDLRLLLLLWLLHSEAELLLLRLLSSLLLSKEHWLTKNYLKMSNVKY